MENTKFFSGNIVKVLLSFSSDAYDYIVPENLELCVGDLVCVPFRNKEEIGIVYGIKTEPLDYDISKVKTIISKFENYQLLSNQVEFIKRVAEYNLTPAGNILKMVIGFDFLTENVIPKKKNVNYIPSYVSPDLSDEQKKATEILSKKLSNGFSVTLLDGITGSGKTEVYFNVINKALKKENAQILILLPEISLTGQFLSKFETRFGIQPVLWHSSVTKAQRRNNWKAIINGEARVIVGTRSALFLPYKNLNLIVLDEEHDSSYKQEDGVIYQGRDMAVLKASVDKIPIILASATPSIETIQNVRLGKYDCVKLTSRFGVAVMPDVDLIDMRQNHSEKSEFGKSWLSSVLVKQIQEKLDAKEQIMLYINRRGYAPLVLCNECGHRLQCPNCNVYLTAHNKDNTKCCCHHCGYSMKLPLACPKCKKENTWALCGPGIERIEEEVRRRFPEARIETISSDLITSQTRLNEIIAKISNNGVDIIIGTQILVKGHHFPNLTLVGVVDGDMSFSSSDLRANENTFQLLTQVSGRAGREKKKGQVMIQTYNPDNSVMLAIKNNDRDAFIKQELLDREVAKMPPFTKLGALILSSKNKEMLEKFCYLLKQKMPVGLDGIQAYGPIDSPLSYLKNYYRKRFLMVVDKKINIQNILKKWLSMVEIPSSVKLKVDVDPYNFM